MRLDAAAGKNAHVRVRRVDNTEVTMIRTYGAHERINVRRAEEGTMSDTGNPRKPRGSH